MELEAGNRPQSMQDWLRLLPSTLKTSQRDDLSSDRNVDYTELRDLLAAGNWRLADEETMLVMLKAAGRDKVGRLSDESIENFPCTDLRTIDQLWGKYSNGRFGFSVQKRIWESVGKNYENFGEAVGWRKKGWWKNFEWITYEDVIFDTKALVGHLPILFWCHRTGSGSSDRRIVSACNGCPSGILPIYTKGSSSLASKLAKCNL
jgi:hypothetical protein